MGDDILQFCGITLSFSLVSQVHLCSDEDAWARLGGGLDLGDPLGASLLETVLVHETEADDEAISELLNNKPKGRIKPHVSLNFL